jgi:hypothetical protein
MAQKLVDGAVDLALGGAALACALTEHSLFGVAFLVVLSWRIFWRS